MGTVKERGLIAKALHVVHREVGRHRAEVRPVGWEAGGVAQHPGWSNLEFLEVIIIFSGLFDTYMQKTCDVAAKAILAKKKLRKKCVNRDKM